MRTVYQMIISRLGTKCWLWTTNRVIEEDISRPLDRSTGPIRPGIEQSRRDDLEARSSETCTVLLGFVFAIVLH